MTRREILKAIRKHPPLHQKVWLECMRIPAGETRTYGWLAEKIGHPGAARSVGRALAKNPFAPTVPCHRVIRSNGSLGGYSAPGGIAAKKRILEKEKRGIDKNR